MNMTDQIDSPQETALWWVCTPSGWAVGWARAPQPWVEQPWDAGRAPVGFPEDEWSITLIQALGESARDRAWVHVWCSVTASQAPPDWWPSFPQGRKRWRAWLQAMDCRLGEMRSIEQGSDASSIWSMVANPEAGSNSIQTTRLSRWALLPAPWGSMLLSALAAMAVHAGVVWGLVPAWTAHRQQQLALAEAAWVAEQQQKSEQRKLAHEAEQAQRVQQWQAHQTQAMQPLQQLEHLLEAVHGLTQPQFWAELRYTDGAWTIFGVAHHESAWHEAVAVHLFDWHPQLLDSKPGVWPPASGISWPAWRFQALVQDPQRKAVSP